MSPWRSEGSPSADGSLAFSWLSLTAMVSLTTGLWFVPAMASAVLWHVLLPLLPAMLLFIPGVVPRINPLAAAAQLPARLDWSYARPVPEVWRRWRYPLAFGAFVFLAVLAKLLLITSPAATAAVIMVLATAAFGLAVWFDHAPGATSPVCPLQLPQVLSAGSLAGTDNPARDAVWVRSMAALLPGIALGWYWIKPASNLGMVRVALEIFAYAGASAVLYLAIERGVKAARERLPGIFAVLALNIHYWYASAMIVDVLRSWGLPLPAEIALVAQTALAVASLYWLADWRMTVGEATGESESAGAARDLDNRAQWSEVNAAQVRDQSRRQAQRESSVDSLIRGKPFDRKGAAAAEPTVPAESGGKASGKGRRPRPSAKRSSRLVSSGDPAIKTVVIIGNGFAGMTAAFNVRRHHPQCRIIVLARESHPTYNRTAIARILNDDTAMASLLTHRQGWYTQHQIEVRLDTEVIALDIEARQLTTASGDLQTWDRLIIAAGAQAWVPAITGFEGPGAFVVREANDVIAMRAYLKSTGAQRVAVLGAGLLGIETAQALRKFGMRVTIVSNSAGVLDRQADAMSSALVGRHLKEKGIEIVKLAHVQTVVRGNDRRVVGLNTDRGVNIAADAVVCCTGTRPALDIYQAAGLATREGIIVDDKMRTSAEHVFAAGDIAEFSGQRIGLSSVAIAQGEVAAAAACGEDDRYVAEPAVTHLKSIGIDFRSYGRVTRDHEDEIELVDLKVGGGQYRKVIVSAGRIVGAILVNHPQLAERYALAVKHQADAAPLLARVKRGDWVILRARPEIRSLPSLRTGGRKAVPEPPLEVPSTVPIKGLSAQEVKVAAMHVV